MKGLTTNIYFWIFLAAGLVALQALFLYFFGQPPICTCGYIKLWEGIVLGSGNSQHLSDWYSFSHIIHGFLFYGLAKLIFPKASWQSRLALAVGIEAAWEVIENTPMVINHYREQALAQGYTGDSIINSVSDTLMAVFGFLLARRLPVWSIIAIAIVLELFTMYMIRDGLALNIINLLVPIEFISRWQSG
jgi:hypothetical protein